MSAEVLAQSPQLPPRITFGDFRIIRALGKGGMGVVFEAESILDGRLVALKVLPGTDHDDTTRKRFLREGRLAAKLNHPNTVYVFGTHDVDGTLAISMELVPGGNLDSIVSEKGPLSVTDAMAAIHGVINGLEAAHELGILHRDVKPSNCFIAIDGSVKLGDFGLSRMAHDGGDGRVTTTGVVMASPAFASPEQLLGEPPDQRSDVYAVGATLYYLLTGALPYPGKEPMHVLAAVMQGAPTPIEQRRRDLPAALARVVSRCMARDAGRRFENYAALRRALSEAVPPDRQPAGIPRRIVSLALDLVLFGAPFALAKAAGQLGPNKDSVSMDFFPVALLVLMLPGLAHRFLGATPGMKIAGIEAIRRDGSRVGALRGTLRFFVALAGIEVALNTVRAAVSGLALFEVFPVFLFWAPLVPLAITLRLTRGLAGPHDLLFGTIVVRARSRKAATTANTLRPSETGQRESLQSLGAFDLYAPAFTGPDGTTVYHAVDRSMDRGVLLHRVAHGAPRVPDSRRAIARPARARWIAGRRTAGDSWDAYAVPHGVRLVDLEQPTTWATCVSWLQLLVSDLSLNEAGPHVSSLGLHDVWVTGKGQALWLDFAWSQEDACSSSEPSRPLGSLLVSIAARATRTAAQPQARFPSVPTSPRIQKLAEDLATVASPQTAAQIVKAVSGTSWQVSRRQRLLLLLFTLGPAAFAAAINGAAVKGAVDATTVSSRYVVERVVGTDYGLSMRWSADPAATFSQNAISWLMHLSSPLAIDAIALADPPPASVERRLLARYLSARHGRSLSDKATRDSVFGAGMRWAAIDSMLDENTLVSARDSIEATQFVDSHVRGKRAPRWAAWSAIVCSSMLLITGLLSLCAILLARRGVLTRALGLEIVTSNSHPARRLKLVIRLLSVWLIAGLAIGILAYTGANLVLAMLIVGVAVVIPYLWLPPSRSLGDYVAGTHVVPE